MNQTCYACTHDLLDCHYAGPCECGCPEFATDMDTAELWLTAQELRALYHRERGTAIGSQAKKAFYTTLDTIGTKAYPMDAATQG